MYNGTNLPTEDIVFRTPVSEHVNDFGEVIEEYETVEIKGCLVRNGVSSPLRDDLRLHQDSQLTVHIPKSYKGKLKNALFSLYGEDFIITSISFPLKRSPLRWNRSGTAELYSEVANG